MKVLKEQNKENLNKTEFCEDDYIVLDYEQLLEVNGAKGSSGGGGQSGPSSGSSGSPSGSSSGSSSGKSSSSGSGSGKGGSKSGQSSPSSSSTSTSTQTGTSTSTTTNSGSKYVENSNEGVANAKPGDKIIRNDGTEVTLTQGDIDWAKSKVNGGSTTNTSQNSSANNSSNNKPNSSGNSSTNSNSNNTNGSTNNTKTATEKVEDAISKIGKKDYTDNYKCDQYAEDVVKTAGYDPKDYHVDDPSGKNVDQHISDLEASGKNNYTTDASKLTEGTYVVFMSDKEKKVTSHAAILVVNSDGTAYMQDNSSHNNVRIDKKTNQYILDEKGNKTYDGGTEKYSRESAAAVCSAYDVTGYDNYYFQKLK